MDTTLAISKNMSFLTDRAGEANSLALEDSRITAGIEICDCCPARTAEPYSRPSCPEPNPRGGLIKICPPDEDDVCGELEELDCPSLDSDRQNDAAVQSSWEDDHTAAPTSRNRDDGAYTKSADVRHNDECHCNTFVAVRDAETTMEETPRRKDPRRSVNIAVPSETPLPKSHLVNFNPVALFAKEHRRHEMHKTPEEHDHERIQNLMADTSNKPVSDQPHESETAELKEMFRVISSLQDTLRDQRDEISALHKDIAVLKNYYERRESASMAPSQKATTSWSPDSHASLLSKASSHCQFCKNKLLPVLEHGVFQELLKLIGCRRLGDVVLTVLLRADNIYHINVRELTSAKVLGCMLANDNAIEEAIHQRVFERSLTFCVIDVRNTLKTRDQAIGITFEFMPDRQRGTTAPPQAPRPKHKPLDRNFVAKGLGLQGNQFNQIVNVSKAAQPRERAKSARGSSAAVERTKRRSNSQAQMETAGVNRSYSLRQKEKKQRPVQQEKQTECEELYKRLPSKDAEKSAKEEPPSSLVIASPKAHSIFSPRDLARGLQEAYNSIKRFGGGGKSAK